MSYEKMSDIKINTLVGMHIGKKIASSYECLKTGACFELVGDTPEISPFNPCNNPSDAWPIIMENFISIDQHYNGSYIRVWGYCDVGLISMQCLRKDALRTAMIVFLKMMEASRG
ncbi:MAG: phage protein NinX family protein [Aeromonadaceae bacterium]